MSASRVPAARLKIGPCPTAAVRRLEQELGIGPVLAEVLVRRGLDDLEQARRWLAADVRHPASAFTGLDSAVASILGHVRRGSRITVHGDYDVDGVCSTAILLAALRRLGADADWYLPSRTQDGYGLNMATVARLAERGTQLLITADCAITAVAEVAAARHAGLDVVVTDHHTPRGDGVLPDAPIVHPSVCGYPCPQLCAAGVAHKLAGALHAGAGGQETTADEDLDLVALATVADVVGLVDENRRLVREGLKALATTSRPGLRALMQVTRLDPSAVTAGAVAFRLAPRINAAGRLYRADAALELLLTTDPERATAVAHELDAMNVERRHTETRIVFEAEAQVARLGEQPAYVLAGEGWHPGVIGIVASRIAERHHRPVVMIGLPAAGAPGAAGTGSGRSIPGFDLLAGLRAGAEHLVTYGGHAAAAGLTIDPGRLEEFRQAFVAHAQATLGAEELTPTERVDAVVCGDEIGSELAEELELLAPFGAGNPEVSLLLRGATLHDARPMGEGRHLRFTVTAGGVRSRAVCFGSDRLATAESEPADATFRLELNEFRGVVEPRLVLRCAQPCRPEPIECLDLDESYLTSVWRELDAALEPEPMRHDLPRRCVIDRRGRPPAGAISRLVASGERVLVLCADSERRRAHLDGSLGGFALCSHNGLARAPHYAESYDHVVVLDPPAHPADDARLAQGRTTQCTHLAWGEPELRFAELVHEHEYGLRASLATLYRALRAAGGADAHSLEGLLRGPAAARSGAQAGRMLRVLAELGLIAVDRDQGRVALLSGARTELERSPSFVAYERRLKDGRRFLRSATAQAA